MVETRPKKDVSLPKIPQKSDRRKHHAARGKTGQVHRKSEHTFQKAFENAPGPISINSPQGKFLKVNRAMCDLIGYTESDLLSMDFSEIVHPDDEKVAREHLSLSLAGAPQIASFEGRYIHKSGRTISAVANITLLRTEQGAPTHFIIHIQDLSQHDHLKEQLLQTQKMKAIGTLAGGVAHDFNNLLMAIQGRVSLMFMNLETDHPHREHLTIIENHIQSAASLTRELLGFARGGKYSTKPTDLNELIKKLTLMFSRTRKEIHIHSRYSPDLWPVFTDQDQIRQAIMNIYINAWQAMPGGGDLFVETGNTTISSNEKLPEDVRPGTFVKVSITDTGIGMDEKTRLRVFEPFFTTQHMGRGTGMGLAFTYGIIRHHGGFITVDSEVEKGTTFCFFLPTLAGIEKKTEKTSHPPKRGETILLVDDDASIIEIGKQLLENIGYNVITADSGDKAIKIYREQSRKIDLVILDMVMPHPNGEKTVWELRKINRNVKIIISSGYFLDATTPPLRDLDFQKFIQKPFNLDELSRAVREVLDPER